MENTAPVPDQIPVNSEPVNSKPTPSSIPSEPVESVQPKNNLKTIVAFLVFLVFALLATTIYFFYQNEQSKQSAVQETNQTDLLPTEAVQPPPVSQRTISDISKNIFTYVDPELLQIEDNIQVVPSSGFTLISSLLSPDGTKIAFSEVSECFDAEQVECLMDSNYEEGMECSPCEVIYRLSVKNLDNDQKDLLYEYPRDGDTKITTQKFSLIIKPVYAALGVIHFHFPYAWAKDSKSLITKDGIMRSMPMGGIPTDFFIIDIVTKEISLLDSSPNVVFDSSFSKAALLSDEVSDLYKCGMGGSLIGDQIRAVDLLTGEVIQQTTKGFYALKAFSQNDTQLDYYVTTKQKLDEFLIYPREACEITLDMDIFTTDSLAM